MKKGLAVLIVLIMSMGSLAAALGPNLPAGGLYGQSTQVPTNAPSDVDSTLIRPDVVPEVETDPMLGYLDTLDPDGPRPPLPPLPGGDKEIGIQTLTDCVLLIERDDEWVPLPTREDLTAGLVQPVSFENGTVHEIHGKLFETIVEANTTYYDDIGITSVPIDVDFDGAPVAMTPGDTGNNTTVIEPFIDTGNGSFQFLLDINKDAGEYELIVHFAGDPPAVPDQTYKPITYRAVMYVNHPTVIGVDVTPGSVTVGQPITISGNLEDDTGRTISSVGMQIRFDNQLLGQTSDGFYLDDVRVTGADYFDNFEDEEAAEWNTYTAPGRGVGNQWMRGSPGGSFGPLAPHSGSNLYGTNLERNYDRGAWSYLVTPRMNFTMDQDYTLSWWSWWSVYWEEDYTYVMVSVDGGSTWDEENAYHFMNNQLISDWIYNEWNVTRYVGSDNVKVAFVFYSIDKTLDVRTDGTFAYQVTIPMGTTADRHRVTVLFKGDLLFRLGQAYEDIDVKRITHFEFELNASKKVGHRNNPVKLVAYLKDNMNEVPQMNIRGHAYFYQITIYWDRTWAVEDGIGERVGPPITMDRDNGEASINYVVAWDQILGPANVTFRFPGDDYYTAIQMTDIYYVKAEVYVSLPGKEELQGFRGQTLDIHGDLRVVADQSTEDQQLGDAVSGEFLKIFWNGQPIGNRRTSFDGTFSVGYLVPSTHELGDVLVMFDYEGQSLYEPITEYANYTVVSETYITLIDQNVYKGEWVYINGTCKDDKDQPVANMPIYIIWKRAPEIGRATSKTDGTFSLQYFIQYEDKVGNISVIARFKGTKIYLANETTSTYTVKVNTILERRDRSFNLVRGQQVQISGKLYEDWGGFRGVEVQREIVTLLIDEIIVSYKRTAFDGSVTFTAPIEPDKFGYGEVGLVLDFNGTSFYEPSRNNTLVVIKANSILTMAEFRVEGEIFDPMSEIVYRDEETYGRILLQDDNFQPIANGNVSVYYKDEGQRARKRLIDTGLTDSQGYFEFNWTFKVNTIGNKTFIAEYDGLELDTFLKTGDLIILPIETYYNVTYDIRKEDDKPLEWYIYAIITGAFVIGAVGIVWSSVYFRRRRQLKKMQRIIRRAADRLVAGNVYSATIFRAYREMAHTLRAYGQLRRDSETFREFEDAVRDALPIDADSLDDFLTVLEEARYSEHEIGENEKDRAIDALRGVQNSIEKILLTDEQIAHISRSGADGMVEPEIIVSDDTGRSAPPKPPQGGGGAAAKPPQGPQE